MTPSRFFRTRWLPRYKVSWCFGALVAAVMTVIIVPGELAEPRLVYRPPALPVTRVAMGWRPPPRPEPWSVVEYSHGWPLEWLRRGRGFNGPDWPDEEGVPSFYGTARTPKQSWWNRPWIDFSSVAGNTLPLLWGAWGPVYASWSIPDAWSFTGDAVEFFFAAFLLDLLMLAGIPLASAKAADVYRGGRGGWWRFRLADTLVVFSLIALALGWWRYEGVANAREREALGALWETEVTSIMGRRGLSYDGPVWLRKLIGSDQLIPRLHRVKQLTVDLDRDNLSRHSRLRDFHSLERVSLTIARDEGYAIEVEQALAVLGPVASLRKLEIDYSTELFYEEAALLASLPQIESLDLGEPWMTSREMQRLRSEYPHLEITQAPSYQRGHWGEEAYEIDPSEQITDQDVCWARFERWGGDAHSSRPYRQGEINLSPIDATADRLELLRPLCDNEDIGRIIFGEKVDPLAAVRFVSKFPGVCTIDLGGAAMTPETLAALTLRGDYGEYDLEVRFRQGRLSAADVIAWAKRIDPEVLYLTITDAQFSPSEVDALDAFVENEIQNGSFIAAYASAADEEDGEPLPGTPPLPTPAEDYPFRGDDPFEEGEDPFGF